MENARLRLPLAILVAAGAAAAATLILRPRSGLIEPSAVSAEAYFSPEQLERARDFRDPQRLLGLAGLAVSGGTLALLALRPPERLRSGFARRPVLGGAAVGAGISVVLVVVNLPLAAVRHERAVDVGLSTQDWLPWAGDVAKAAGVEALFAAGGGALALALVRRFKRRWWLPASACAIGIGVVSLWLFPVLVDPLFNRFDPLPTDSRLRAQVLDLAREAGVDVGEVYRIDASRRTTGVNAYVGGLGPTKRVVLYDNLVERFPPDQVRSVVAHELAHQKHRDLWRGLAWLALVAPAALFLGQALAERIDRYGGLRDPARARPAALPALALSLGLVSLVLGSASNVLSRQVEARADGFALRLTRDPGAFIALERRLALANVSDPDPPALLHALFGTHPTTVERIGSALPD